MFETTSLTGVSFIWKCVNRSC